VLRAHSSVIRIVICNKQGQQQTPRTAAARRCFAAQHALSNAHLRAQHLARKPLEQRGQAFGDGQLGVLAAAGRDRHGFVFLVMIVFSTCRLTVGQTRLFWFDVLS
jgi:hypothetical protein